MTSKTRTYTKILSFETKNQFFDSSNIFLSKTNFPNSSQNKIDENLFFFLIESKIGTGKGETNAAGQTWLRRPSEHGGPPRDGQTSAASSLQNSYSPVFTSGCVLKNRRVPTVTAHRWNIGSSHHNTSNRASINT